MNNACDLNHSQTHDIQKIKVGRILHENIILHVTSSQILERILV